MSIFLLGTGALYGVLVAYFQRMMGAELQGVALEQFSDVILYGGNIVSGILIAMVFHGGVTLVLWLMARAVGGPGRLGLLYKVGAYLLPLTYPALPFLAAHSVTEGAIETLGSGNYFQILAGFSVVLLLPGLYGAIRVTQGLGTLRTALAVGLFVLFCTSIVIAI
jgi:hypothetical protein